MLDRPDEARRIEAAARRFEERTPRRRERWENLKNLDDGGDWRRVDTPDRVLRRLGSLGWTHLAAEMLGGTRDGAERPAVLYERILAGDDTLGARFLRTGAEVSRSVGRIARRSDGFGFGTGFLVSPRLLMTNNHVLRSASEAAAAAVQFDYAEDEDGHVTPVVHALQPELFFLTDVELDYSLVAVATSADDGTPLDVRSWNPLITESGKLVVGERANIVQHPGGKPQRVALRNNALLDVVDDFLHYEADTEPGSSGSPVFNDQWELAALHHAGVPKRGDGNVLLRDGTPWNGSSSTRHLIDWVANEGVRISSIVADLRAKLSDGSEAARLLAPAFGPRPELQDGAPQGAPDRNGAGVAVAGPRVGADGVAHWTVPVHLSVRVGDAGGADVVAPARTGDAARRVPAVVGSGPAPVATDGELAAALALVEDNAGRTYYDEDADQDAFDAYYAGLPEEATVEEWFELFGALVRGTHETKVRYDDARRRHLYPWIDLHENADGSRELRSVYSGKGFDANEVLRQDFEAERRRQEGLLELFRAEVAPSPAAVEARLDELERAHPFNCEHVVPQSWFGKDEPMRGDLHHLFTCEWGCNSFRSNVPYWDFTLMEEESVRHDCGRRETGKFEPAFNKGAVARATMYFLLRYPGEVGDASRELSADRLRILLHWHESEPAGVWEWHRNAAIQEAQGNRNPLIDYPGMAAWMALHLGFATPGTEGLEAGTRDALLAHERQRFAGKGRRRRRRERAR